MSISDSFFFRSDHSTVELANFRRQKPKLRVKDFPFIIYYHRKNRVSSTIYYYSQRLQLGLSASVTWKSSSLKDGLRLFTVGKWARRSQIWKKVPINDISPKKTSNYKSWEQFRILNTSHREERCCDASFWLLDKDVKVAVFCCSYAESQSKAKGSLWKSHVF